MSQRQAAALEKAQENPGGTGRKVPCSECKRPLDSLEEIQLGRHRKFRDHGPMVALADLGEDHWRVEVVIAGVMFFPALPMQGLMKKAEAEQLAERISRNIGVPVKRSWVNPN